MAEVRYTNVKMPFFGELVVIKRNGTDGTHFPLTAKSCLFGRKKECDIRIQLPQVSKEHCKIEVNENKEAVLFNLSSANPTQLNGNHFQDPTHLKHGDILTIIDRSFRFEYPPPSLSQKRLPRSPENETLQTLHVQHMQQMDLMHPHNPDYKSSPITGKKFEMCSSRSNEKRLQEQYITPEFKYKMYSTEKANELSPFSKCYELMTHEDGTDNVKGNTGNETLLKDVYHSRSRRSSMNQAKLTEVEHSEDGKIQGKGGIVASPIPVFFEEKNSERSSSIQNHDIQQKQDYEDTNQSDFKDIEDNEVEKDEIRSANTYAHFEAKTQSMQDFPESYIVSDYTEKAKEPNKFNLTDAFTSVENTLLKANPSRKSTQNYSIPWIEIDSLNKMKSSGEMEECTVQLSGQECACLSIEAIDKESIIPADLSQISEIMANQILERTLERECPTNENKKTGIEGYEQNVNMRIDKPAFSSSYENSIQTSADVNAVFEMNLCPLKNKNSEAKKSPQKHRGTKLDFLGKRKRVSFGDQLSPELFDKHLPPNTPLKRGAIPARQSMPFGNSPQAVLKRVAELRHSITQGSFDGKQSENTVPKQAASQRQQCTSDPHVANLSSEGEETTTQEMHMTSLFSEVKKTESNPTSSLRRSKPRRSSICGKSGGIGTIHSKRRSGASEANLIVAKSWADVVKQGVPKLQLKSASKQGFKTRSMKKVASKLSKNNNLLKTPKRKISSHFSTGHANSPAPIVIGKACTRILNKTAQVPKVVINYSMKQYCDFNENFTGLAQMFRSPPDGKQKKIIPEAQISDINASEESGKKSVLDFNIPNPKRAHNQDEISPVLEVSQISIHDNVMVSLNEENIMRMEDENLQQESEPIRQLLEIKSLLKTPKEKSEPVESLSEVKRFLRTRKQKSEPVGELSGVKRFFKTPKNKSEPVESLSGVNRIFKTPKEKSEPVESLSGVKRIFKTPKEKSEPVESVSGVKRIFKKPKEKSEPVESLSGVNRIFKTPKEKTETFESLSGVKSLLKTPKEKSESIESLSEVKRFLRTRKQKSEPVVELSGVKRLFKTPKEKSEPVESLSGIKRLLKTPEQKSEPVEVFSEIKMLKTPKEIVKPLTDDIYSKSMLPTEEVLKNIIGSVTKSKTKQNTQTMEDANINDITEEIKKVVKPTEDGENIQLMTLKQRFEPINNMFGNSQTLKTSKPKSLSTDDYLRLQNFMIESKESSIIPVIDYTDVKGMMDSENDMAGMPESMNLVEENGSYISSRNKLESMENVPESCKANLELTFEKESHFPVTKNNSSIPNNIDHFACNSLKTEFNKETTSAISVSENYESDGTSSKNEAKTDYVKEIAENSDALKTEKFESFVLTRSRRRKINDCSSAVYTRMIQRHTKNRSTSANCEQMGQNFDSHTELNLLHKSESNFTAIETNQLSQRGRPKKLVVETNENIESDNISYTQELEKSLKERTVKKQSVNRRKIATKWKGKREASMDLEQNGLTQEIESDLTSKTWLRSRNVRKSASDLKTMFAKGKTNYTMSGEESNKRRKIAAIQSTLNTSLNEDKQERQTCTISKIIKTEPLENNLTAINESLAKNKKKVQFLLKNDIKVSEEKCALGYESNTHKEESQAENICNGIPKVPLGSMQTPVDPSPPKIEKLSKNKLPSRGRGRKSNSSPSIECDSKLACDVKNHDVIVSLKENQPKRGRQRKIIQVLPKLIPLENNSFGEKDSTVNKFPSSQGGCTLPPILNGNFEESEMLPLENVQNLKGHIPPKRVVEESQPRRGRSKSVNETSNNEEADVQIPNMAITQENNQSKGARRKRNAQESCSLKSQRTVKENPPKRGRQKKTTSGDISTDSSSIQIATIIEQNIDDKNACLAKEDQSKVGARTKSTLVFQKTISSVKNDTFNLLLRNREKHSDEKPSEDLQTANDANENFTYKFRKSKAVYEISANSVSSTKKSEFIDNDIQENEKKDSKAVSKQKTPRSKIKQLTPCVTSAESNDELRIRGKKIQPVTDNVDPLENSWLGKKRQSEKQREKTKIPSLVSPSLKVSIALSPSSSNENQSRNCRVSVETRKLAMLSGTYNIMTRSLKGKCTILKEKFVHEKQNNDLQRTAMATVINERRCRRKINKLEAAVSSSLKEKHTLATGSDNFPDEQIPNNVSNTITQNINQSNLSNYDRNKNVEHSNKLLQKSSSKRAKRKQISNSETITTTNMVKNVIPENKSTVSKTENTESITVQRRGKKKMKEENTTLMTVLPRETEGRTRASKRMGI